MLFKNWKKFFFIITSVGIGLYLSWGPWRIYLEQKAMHQHSQKKLKEMQSEWVNLKKEHASLENSWGKEEIARKKGYKGLEENFLK